MSSNGKFLDGNSVLGELRSVKCEKVMEIYHGIHQPTQLGTSGLGTGQNRDIFHWIHNQYDIWVL